MGHWQSTACVLCENNCGIEVELGGVDDRHFTRIRGDRAHPASQGYLCQKATRLDYYQNGRDRLLAPQRRRADGTFESIDWETAIREIAERLLQVKAQHGGASVFHYGGAGQGNHLPAMYAGSTLSVLGSVFRSNALAQEKTGEFWVNGNMFAAPVRGDFEHCEVALFVGKNPWQSHGVPRARVVLKEIAKDPGRTMIVVDPRVSETAELADYHLQLRPGTDAWLMSALVSVLVQEKLTADDWLEDHADGAAEVLEALRRIPISEYCRICGVAEELVREVARRIAGASGGVSVYEDLGIQMNRHSTLVSYLNKLVWVLTGNFARHGAQNVISMLQPLTIMAPRGPKRSPVAEAKIITGLVPCNVIAEEILTDHPDRYRAMIVESSNPAHSLADSQRMREALASLECLVVVDVAMTETAKLADYVLPVPTQYEKWEATFFNLDFPENYFHLRRPLLQPPAELLTEPEIHTRLVEAMGAMPQETVQRLNTALDEQPESFPVVFQQEMKANRDLRWLAPVVLYRTLGPRLPGGAASAAALWPAAHACAASYPESLRRAGFEGEVPQMGQQLFEKLLSSPSGFVFTVDEPDVSWGRLRTADSRIRMALPEMLERLSELDEEPPANPEEFPFVLSAGERRSYTANTIYRDPNWRRNGEDAALRICPSDAGTLGVADGGTVRLTTKRGSVSVSIEISDRMQPGHVSLPNGTGLLNEGHADNGLAGIAPNELTASEDRDWIAGTPWHKYIPAHIEVV